MTCCCRDGSCCPKPGSLDANFDCCGGAVDECGVCWGEGSTCLVVLPVTLRLPQALQAPARAAVGSFQGPSAAFVASLSVSVGAVLERCGVRSRNVTARVLEVSGGPLTSLDGVLESNGGRRLAGADKDGGSNEEGSRAAAEGPEASGLPLDKVIRQTSDRMQDPRLGSLCDSSFLTYPPFLHRRVSPSRTSPCTPRRLPLFSLSRLPSPCRLPPPLPSARLMSLPMSWHRSISQRCSTPCSNSCSTNPKRPSCLREILSRSPRPPSV